MTTNFFFRLQELAQGVDVTLRIKEKNGKYTILFWPEIANANKLKVLTLTGTVEELDAEFFKTVQESMTPVQGLVTNVEEVKNDASVLASEAKKAAPEKKSAESGKKKPEKGNKKGNSGKKSPTPAPKIQAPASRDIFSQEPAAADPSTSPAEKTDKEVDEELTEEGQPDETD